MRPTFWHSWLALLCSVALGATSCADILGIEDLSAGGETDSGYAGNADGAKGGQGGRSSAGSGGMNPVGQGGSVSGGRSALDPDAGSDASAGGRAEAPDAAAEAGPSGSGGSEAGVPDGMPRSPTVRGKVIDYNQNPVPGVVVKVGDASVTTDGDGAFVIDEAPDRYDVGLTITVARYGGTQIAGWLFVGLTRRDPTLQVYRGLPLRSGDFNLTTQNATFPLPEGEEIRMGLGGTYGTFEYDINYASISSSGSWEGPVAVQGTAHALRWTNDTAAPRLPTAYLSHDVRTVALDATTDSQITFDLESSGTLPTALVSGNVSSVSGGDRRNAAFLRFTDGAAIQLVDHRSAPDAFSYLVPTVQNASMVVSAIAISPGYAVAYADQVTPGTADVALTVPVPATPLSPSGNSSNVDEETLFSWDGPDQVYMLHVENANYYESFYVVASAKEARIPAPPRTNLPLAAGQEYWWQVMTHGHYATVDDATGPTGFLDAYCYGVVSGPRRGHGTHTESASLDFTTAP